MSEAQNVRELLRRVKYPGFSRDIVASGFVGDIVAAGGKVQIEFKPVTSDADKILAMESDIRSVLQGADYGEVEIRRVKYVTDIPLRSAEDLVKELDAAKFSRPPGGNAPNKKSDDQPASRPMTPLQAELLEDGELPEPDLLAKELGRLDVAPGAGYGPGGPNPMSGPREGIKYEVTLPVLQWDIDPHNAEARTCQHEIKLDDWDYRVWWQVHKAGDIFYVSMQAMKEDWVDHDNNAVPHPIGRSEAVNLVFDERRNAVVAIYGTVRDFRPFVKAFELAYGIENGAQGRPDNQEAADQ